MWSAITCNRARPRSEHWGRSEEDRTVLLQLWFLQKEVVASSKWFLFVSSHIGSGASCTKSIKVFFLCAQPFVPWGAQLKHNSGANYEANCLWTTIFLTIALATGAVLYHIVRNWSNSLHYTISYDGGLRFKQWINQHPLGAGVTKDNQH
jgi:hypothetical protein